VPLLLTVPGIGWVLAHTIAAEIGDIGRFPTARKLAGYTGLCPRVYQSGERDLRGPLAKQGHVREYDSPVRLASSPVTYLERASVYKPSTIEQRRNR
jgi:Transposase IS116/IS110/IS902 family